MSDQFQENAIGASLLVTLIDPDSQLPIDISSATTKNLILQRPDGTEVTVAASFLTNGKDGNLQYITISGDLNQVGQWNVQADLVIPALSYTGRSFIGQFNVNANL